MGAAEPLVGSRRRVGWSDHDGNGEKINTEKCGESREDTEKARRVAG
jgi:hypothetical protein